LRTFDNAITSLKQIDAVLDILQSKKAHTNGDLVAMVLVIAEMEKIAPTRAERERDPTKYLRRVSILRNNI
jgi:hypothetical protein